MIAEFQPTKLPQDRIVVRFSSLEDGNMKNGTEAMVAEVTENRRRFLGQFGLGLEKGHLVKVTYDGENYLRYGMASAATQSLTKPHEYVTPPHDALVHNIPSEALILPLADCEGLVLYDPRLHKMMLSHLGRHSTLQKGGRMSVQFMVQTYGTRPEDVLAYLTPAAGKENYPLRDLGGRGLQEEIIEQLREAGLSPENIEASPYDTTTDARLFSHSEFLKGNRPMNGRQMLVAALLPLNPPSVTLE